MTRQEIFDKVWAGLKGQGFERSITEEGICVYRGPNGTKCAAGHVLPDEEYDPEYDEGGGCHVGIIPWFANNFHDSEYSFLVTLQRIHDKPYLEASVLERKLRNFAAEQGLTIND